MLTLHASLLFLPLFFYPFVARGDSRTPQDGEFILYRGQRPIEVETDPPSVLAPSPLMEHPTPATLKKLEHESSFKDELDAAHVAHALRYRECYSRA
jgi:hypothetical protein